MHVFFVVLMKCVWFYRDVFSSLLVYNLILFGLRFQTLRLAGSTRKKLMVGEIVNLMSIDAQKFQDAPTFSHIVWTAPITIVVALYFIWQEIGPSSLAGLALMIVLVPINGIIVSKARKLQVNYRN